MAQEEEEATVKAAASDPMEGEGDDLSSESEDENEQRRPNSNPNGGRSTGGSGGSGGSNAGTPTADAMHMGELLSALMRPWNLIFLYAGKGPYQLFSFFSV